MTRSASTPVCELSRRSFHRILLIKPSSLGDVIHALPVLRALRTKWPDAEIDWLIEPTFAPLIEGHADIHELILFHRREYGRMFRSPSACARFVRFLRDLRRRRYDLAIDLQGLFRSGFLARASGADVRVGFRDAREAGSIFYTHLVPRLPDDLHAVDRNLRVGELLGLPDLPVEFPLPMGDESEREIRGLPRRRDFSHEGRLVMIAPGARWETKKWPEEKFVETIDKLHERNDVKCVLVGSKEDVHSCRRISDACRTAPMNLAGETTLPQLKALLARASVVLCHDSGTMHLAVALNRPVVCLIGPTNPLRTGPYRRLNDVVRLDLDCSPCYLRKLRQCPHGHKCMKALSVGQVMDAVRRALADENGSVVTRAEKGAVVS